MLGWERAPRAGQGPRAAGLEDTPSEGIQEQSPHVVRLCLYETSQAAKSTHTESRGPAARGEALAASMHSWGLLGDDGNILQSGGGDVCPTY